MEGATQTQAVDKGTMDFLLCGESLGHIDTFWEIHLHDFQICRFCFQISMKLLGQEISRLSETNRMPFLWTFGAARRFNLPRLSAALQALSTVRRSLRRGGVLSRSSARKPCGKLMQSRRKVYRNEDPKGK